MNTTKNKNLPTQNVFDLNDRWCIFRFIFIAIKNWQMFRIIPDKHHPFYVLYTSSYKKIRIRKDFLTFDEYQNWFNPIVPTTTTTICHRMLSSAAIIIICSCARFIHFLQAVAFTHPQRTCTSQQEDTYSRSWQRRVVVSI